MKEIVKANPFTALAPIDDVRNWLDTQTDVKKVSDTSKAVAAAKNACAKGDERRTYFTTVSIWADRRLGELLIAGMQDGTIATKGDNRHTRKRSHDATSKTLNDLGINKNQSSRCQGLAEPLAEVVEETVEEITSTENKKELSKGAVLTALKKKEKIDELEEVEAIEVKKAEGIYDVIVIDPPWDIKKIERYTAFNQTLLDYPVMSLEEIASLEIPTAKDCHVWLWTTHKYLPHSFGLLDRWGLNYVCCFVWHKAGGFQPVELPQYNCEFVVYARCGSPVFLETKNFPVCFDAKRGKHSEKPESFYDTVRRVTGGRRLDMFNRREIAGFDTWGKEAK